MLNENDFTRAKYLDVNGNPRYICHFLRFISKEENERFWKDYGIKAIQEMYKFACKRANKVGGRKYHNKQYGGGIIFQSYNIKQDAEIINEFLIKEWSV